MNAVGERGEDTASTAAPEPEVRRRGGPSLVWIIPIVVAVVGGWLVYKTLSEKGPVVTIAFQTAAGLEAGKTKIRYKNIEIGAVESLRFSDDFSRVIVTAQMAKDTGQFLRRGTRFWVVKPRLSLRGVSGLATLVSGAYIEIEPGEGAEQSHFEGLEEPPVVRAEEAGMRVTLVSDELGSLGPGSPIYYRGILAGEVLGHELGTDRKSVFVHAFVRAPFHRLVRSNTRFWNVSGMDVEVSSEGIAVRTESMESVLFGGVAFETPESPEPVKSDLEGVVFTLHDDRESIEEQSFTQRVRFVLFFEGSVRGLNVGAPVEFKGIKVGEVVDIRLEFDSRDTTFRIPVLIEIEPERVIATGSGAGQSPYEVLATLVERGLRGRLQTGSLITGQLFVDLDMRPETEIRLVEADLPYPELPTIPARLAELTSSVKGFLANVNQVDFGAIGQELEATLAGANRVVNSEEIRSSLANLEGTLAGANRVVNSAEVRSAVADLEASMAAFRGLLVKVDARVEPLAENVDRAVTAGRDALAKLQVTLGYVDTLLQSDSPLQFRYIQMAEELTETARSIRAFVDLLERNPQSVLFGKPGPGAN